MESTRLLHVQTPIPASEGLQFHDEPQAYTAHNDVFLFLFLWMSIRIYVKMSWSHYKKGFLPEKALYVISTSNMEH